jgi:hypothetical protein
VKLSKLVPARTKTVTALWCRKDFLAMSQKVRDIRSGFRDKMRKCFWCNHKFADGEMMALASFEHFGNKVLCQLCADELLLSDSDLGPNDEKT